MFISHKMSMLWPTVLSLLCVPHLTAVRVFRPEHSDLLYRAPCDVQNAMRICMSKCVTVEVTAPSSDPRFSGML
jgi:hypothetical protein